MADTAKLYMRLTGPGNALIKGECEILDHEGEIEIDDWRWNLNTNKTNGDPEPSTFAFGKLMDSATPRMLRALAQLGSGAAEPMKAVIQLADHGSRGTGGKPLFEMTMTLERVFVLDYTMRLKPEEAGGSIEEDWVFDYETLRIDYRSAFHPGTSTVTFLRPPGSSTEAPSSRRNQIVKLAETISGQDNEELWRYIRNGLDENRFPSSLNDVLKRIDSELG
jgi:type VI protein secretion system component Hcp